MNRVRVKAKEAAVIRLAIDSLNQKALSGLMNKSRRRDGETVKLINKFNSIRNLILDMDEIEIATRSGGLYQHNRRAVIGVCAF
jgi:hypothetical protein